MTKHYMQRFLGGAFGLVVLALSGCAERTPDTAHAALTAEGFAIEDKMFAQPYIDEDEMRADPVPHRYVHGGFKGTDTRFSYYFPPADDYEGRFFQHVTPVPISENLAQQAPNGEYNKIGFSIDSGAYFIETNGGGTPGPTAGRQPDGQWR